MKVLSIRQPWAWLIVNGHKDIENRTWHTKYRGDFLIHAGTAYTEKTHDWYTDGYQYTWGDILIPSYRELKKMCGGIVGQATIIDCVLDHPSSWKDDGSWGFVLANAKPLSFRELKGRLGFFNVPEIAPAEGKIERAGLDVLFDELLGKK